MPMIQALKYFGLTRVFALLALLCVLGLQSLEVSHSHAHQDGTVECLACKSSATGVTAIAPVLNGDEQATPVPLAETPAAARVAAFSLYDSRGPPLFS